MRIKQVWITFKIRSSNINVIQIKTHEYTSVLQFIRKNNEIFIFSDEINRIRELQRKY